MKEYNPFIDPSLDGNIIIDKLNGRFLTVSGTTPVAMFGRRDGRQGFYSAKPGFDVRNATDDQLAYNSDQDTFKIVDVLTSAPFSLSSGGSQGITQVTVDHDLGYKPLAMYTVDITNNTVGDGGFPTATGTYPIPYFTEGITGANFVVTSFVKLGGVTTSTFTFNVGISAASQNIAGFITIYVLHETAS